MSLPAGCLPQVADLAFSAFGAPAWLLQVFLVLLLPGLPTALIFAWAFEITPEGLKKEKDVERSESITHVTGRRLDFIIISVLAIAVVVFAIERFVLLPNRIQETAVPSEMIETAVQRSIAVLPFVNMSPDPDQEYFSDGLTEEILNLLSRMPELKVISRTSSFAFKGKNEDSRVIGETLGVATLLEGSVRKSGDRVRVTAQLIDVSDGTNIWSDTSTRAMIDIFELQDDVAGAIIDELELHVANRPRRGRPTNDTEA